jgi:hypothetical protein
MTISPNSAPSSIARRNPLGIIRFTAALSKSAGAVWNPKTSSYNRVSLPAAIEAEDFDRYYDTSSSNAGGAYRVSGVDIKQASESSGTYAVGWMRTGEWFEYDVTIPTAGVYNFEARVASAESAKTFHLEVAGVDVSGPMVVPDTGPGNTAWALDYKEGHAATVGRQWRPRSRSSS